MQIGKLRYLVALQEKTATQNELGEVTYSYNTVDTVYANIRDLTGRELNNGLAIAAQTTHLITIRYYGNLRTDWIVNHNGDIYEIVSIKNIQERDFYLELQATKI